MARQPMHRYYFNITDDYGSLADNEGTQLTDAIAAQREAEIIARELLVNNIRSAEPIDDRRVEVRDEGGTVITSVYLRDLVH